MVVVVVDGGFLSSLKIGQSRSIMNTVLMTDFEHFYFSNKMGGKSKKLFSNRFVSEGQNCF